LYHYLMSFPYRLIDGLIGDYLTKLIIMRFINIGLFVGGLFIFRKLLLRLGASSALTHFSLLMLVLLPVTPFLAAHINYDNMLFLLLPLNLLLVLNCVQSMSRQHQLEAKGLILMIVAGLLTSLVKYVFLPIFAASIVYLLAVWIWDKQRRVLHRTVLSSFKALRLSVKVGLVVALVVSSGLFLQRYGVNVVKYHSIHPDCSRVQPIEDCLQYGPWARNYKLKVAAQSSTSRPVPQSLPEFIPSWTNALIYKLYFAINYDFKEYAPMPLPISMAYLIGGLGIILTLAFARPLRRANRHILLPVVVTLAYGLSLLYVNYTEYRSFDSMVAVNGRYFIPLLPFIFVIIGLAYRQVISKYWPTRAIIIKSSLVIVATVVALQGGGMLTYLIHSEPIWYWPNDPLTAFNVEAQKIVTSLVIGAQK
ncbi:MAG: DUF2142 domain-containing protein, partial [Candidatus Saccharibacteria bacterium]